MAGSLKDVQKRPKKKKEKRGKKSESKKKKKCQEKKQGLSCLLHFLKNGTSEDGLSRGINFNGENPSSKRGEKEKKKEVCFVSNTMNFPISFLLSLLLSQLW